MPRLLCHVASGCAVLPDGQPNFIAWCKGNGDLFDQGLRTRGNRPPRKSSFTNVIDSFKALSIRNTILTIGQEYFDIFIIFLTFPRTAFT